MKAPKPSADLVAWGIILWFGGTIVAAWGAMNPHEGLFGSVSASPWFYVGGIASLIGVLLLSWGAYRAAHSIDALVKDLHARQPSTPTTPPDQS